MLQFGAINCSNAKAMLRVLSRKACYQYFVLQKTVLHGLLPIFLSLFMSMLFFPEWILWWWCRSCIYFKLHDWKIPEAAFLFLLCTEGNSNSLWTHGYFGCTTTAPIITLWFWSFIKNWDIDWILPFPTLINSLNDPMQDMQHFISPDQPWVRTVSWKWSWMTDGGKKLLKK